MTSYPLAILLTSILFCTGTTVLTIMLKCSNSSKDKLLTEMQTALHTLQNGFADSADHEQRPEAGQTSQIFVDNLRVAGLTTRLQQPRLTMQQCGYSPATPERYRYIQSMVAKGMSAEEIAAMFSMSLHETTQLVTLIRVARQQQGGNGKPLPSLEVVTPQQMDPATVASQTSQCARQQPPASKRVGTVKKSIKLARWAKSHAVVPCLRNKNGREPPPHPLPRADGLSYHPLPG